MRYAESVSRKFDFTAQVLPSHFTTGEKIQVRLVSVKAEQPNHPSRGGPSQGGGQLASRGGVHHVIK